MRLNAIVPVCILLMACGDVGNPSYVALPVDTVQDAAGNKTVIITPTDGTAQIDTINTGNITPQQLINFAKTAIGIPYKYATSNPMVGFDCSGFITYVFNHFGIFVPRSSVDFTNVKHEIPLGNSRPGDLILFTGTNSSIHTVGHMGIITTSYPDSVRFIHSTSGKAMGVTISPLNKGYMKRFVKVVRVFPEEYKQESRDKN